MGKRKHRGGRKRRTISNESSITTSRPLDRVAQIRADQIREGRRMMAAERGQSNG